VPLAASGADDRLSGCTRAVGERLPAPTLLLPPRFVAVAGAAVLALLLLLPPPPTLQLSRPMASATSDPLRVPAMPPPLTVVCRCRHGNETVDLAAGEAVGEPGPPGLADNVHVNVAHGAMGDNDDVGVRVIGA